MHEPEPLPNQSNLKRVKQESPVVLASFEDLPCEIYAEIFDRVMQRQEGGVGYDPRGLLIPVSYVCKRWRSFLLDYGKVWKKSVGEAFLLYHTSRNDRGNLNWALTVHCRFHSGMLETAARCGHLSLFRWLLVNRKVPWTDGIWKAAAEGGHVPILRSLYASRGREVPTQLCHHAARTGKVDALGYLLRVGANYHIENLFYDSSIACMAACHGHIGILEYLVKTSHAIPRDVWSAAVRENRVNVLKWLALLGFIEIPADIYATAARYGSLETLQWLLNGGYTPPNRGIEHAHMWCDAIARADLTILNLLYQRVGADVSVRWGHSVKRSFLLKPFKRDVIEWAHRTPNFPLPSMEHAVNAGNLGVVRWLHETLGEVISVEHAKLTAILGKLDVLEWLYEQRAFTLDDATTECVAERGFVHILEWMYAHGMKMKGDTFISAMKKGESEVVRWAHAHDIPLNARVFAMAAVNAATVTYADAGTMLKWLYEHGCPYDDLCVLEWLRGQRTDLIICKWLIKIGCPWTERFVDWVVDKRASLKMLQHLDPGNPRVSSQPSDADSNTIIYRYNNSNNKDSNGMASLKCLENTKQGTAVLHNVWKRGHVITSLKRGTTEVTKWLIDRVDVTRDSKLIKKCLQRGADANVLKHLLDRGCPADSTLFEHAVCLPYSDSQPMLRVLCTHGCPMDPNLMDYVVDRNAYDTIPQLHRFGCPWTSSCLEIVVKDWLDHSLLSYMRKHNCLYTIGVYSHVPGVCLRGGRGVDERELPSRLKWLWKHCPLPPGMIQRECPTIYSRMQKHHIIQEDERWTWTNKDTEWIKSADDKRRCQRMLDRYNQNDGVCRRCTRPQEGGKEPQGTGI